VRRETERDARGDESGHDAGARAEDAQDPKKERQSDPERKKRDARARRSRPESDARLQNKQVDKEGRSEAKQESVVHGQNLRRRPTRAELEAARARVFRMSSRRRWTCSSSGSIRVSGQAPWDPFRATGQPVLARAKRRRIHRPCPVAQEVASC